MALITVYDPAGLPVTVEPVDAREYVQSGGYTSSPPKAVDAAPPVDEAAEVMADQPDAAPGVPVQASPAPGKRGPGRPPKLKTES